MAKKKAIKTPTKKEVAPKKATSPKVAKSKTKFIATSKSPEYSEGTEIKVSEVQGMKMVNLGWAIIK